MGQLRRSQSIFQELPDIGNAGDGPELPCHREDNSPVDIPVRNEKGEDAIHVRGGDGLGEG
jgi:hypothetical protein